MQSSALSDLGAVGISKGPHPVAPVVVSQALSPRRREVPNPGRRVLHLN